MWSVKCKHTQHTKRTQCRDQRVFTTTTRINSLELHPQGIHRTALCNTNPIYSTSIIILWRNCVGKKRSLRGHLPLESKRNSEKNAHGPGCSRLEAISRIFLTCVYKEELLSKKLTYLLTYLVSQTKREKVS